MLITVMVISRLIIVSKALSSRICSGVDKTKPVLEPLHSGRINTLVWMEGSGDSLVI